MSRDSRVRKQTALQGIREQFNPFEINAAPRKKYDFANSKILEGRVGKGAVSRPGLTKARGEENVWVTLLIQIHGH